MPQKPTGINWDGLPDQKAPTGIDWSMLPDTEEPKGFLGQLWSAVSEPLWNAPREWARETAMSMTDPRKRLDAQGNVRPMHPLASFGAGVLEGVGGVASDLTSPINIGATLASGGSYGAARAGLPQIARGLNTAARVVSAPVAVHGGMVATDPNASWGERAMGVAEMAGGAAGMMDPGPNLGPRNQPRPTNVPPPRPWNPMEDVIDLGPEDYTVGDPFKRLNQPPPPPPNQRALPPGPEPVRQAPIDDIDALIAELNGQQVPPPDAGFTLVDPEMGLANNASGESAASVEAMNRDRGMRERGQQFMVFDRTGQARPLIGVDAVDYAVRPGETYGIMNRDGSFQVLDDMGGNFPRNRQPQQADPGLQNFASQFDEILPQQSLTDRPVEIRTMEELEARISDLEQKPALNAGGQRALEQMRSEVHKRRLMEQEQFEGVQDIDPNMPQGARTEGGGVKIGADVKSLGKVLGTSLYQGNISTVATKELLQNSLDAVRHLGSQGKIRVDFDESTGHVGISDNGRGMTPAEIQSIFTDLGSSGKRSDEGAIGGFGLAKAAPLLGGESVEVRTVARDPGTGQLIETKFSGTPDELLEGVNMDTQIVPEGTETGTSVRVKVPPGKYGYSFYEAKDYANRMARNSRGIEAKIEGMEKKSYGSENIMDYKPSTPIEMANVTDPAGNIGILRPSDQPLGDFGAMNWHLLNKGMYQGTVTKYLNNPVPGIPKELMIDIDAKVPEGDPNYPFTANRESLRGSVLKAVEKYVDEEILNPARNKHAAGLQALYDGMPSVVTPGGTKLYFHDTQAKFSKQEYVAMMKDPVIMDLGDQISSMIADTLTALNNPQSKFKGEAWLNRLERVGIIFDDGLRGIHIPNPSTGHSAILINPLQLMKGKTPDSAAMGFVHTVLHEMAHIDPDVRGHDENFAIRLADVHELFGARRTINAQQQFLETVSDADTGDYYDAIHDLLRGYTKARGREAVKEDILRRTGVDSKAEAGTKKGNGKSPSARREGTSIILENGTPESSKRIMEAGYVFKGMRDDGTLEFVPGRPPKSPILESETNRPNARPTPKNAAGGGFPPGQGPPPRGRGPTPPSGSPSGSGPTPAFQNTPEKRRWWVEAYNLPRALMASIDFSAPLRQGMTLIHKKAFWASLDDMVRSWGSQKFYDATMEGILERPLFKARLQPNGKMARSFAEEAGLRFTDLKSLATREEAIMSSWAEKIPGLGRAVKASNRAYTGFLNKLRADTFEQVIRDSKVFGADGTTNLPLARSLAEYVNNATGRGSLGRLEQSAVALNSLLFSPRLIASRLKFLNPKTYWSSPAPVRKEYIKSLFAVAAVGNTVVQLGKLAGGEVNNNPNSSDYGKLQIGNVRLDPYAGFQQYVVAANRLLRPSWAELPAMRDVEGGPANLALPIDLAAGWAGQGGQQMTSSTSGRQYDLWNQQGPFDPTWMDIATRFFRGKAHPVLGFALSLAMGAKEMDGTPMNFGTANPMENAVMQRFIPIFLQDLYELANEDPKLIPILAPLTASGMSIQTYGGDNKR